jgi:hypothetical protein
LLSVFDGKLVAGEILRMRIALILRRHMPVEDALERANNLCQVLLYDLDGETICDEIEAFLMPNSVKVGIPVAARRAAAVNLIIDAVDDYRRDK